jgi:ribokinase
MHKAPVIVIGSSNTDMVIKTAHLPLPGETILGGTFFMNAGGKGANQAVAAARLGGAVTFIAKLGDDIFGREALQLFKKEGIDTDCIVVDAQHPSGVALITVDDKGENCIAVASGANAQLLPADAARAKDKIAAASIMLAQLEIPVETVAWAAAEASAAGVPVILNPAPACTLPDELYKHLYIITSNETEAEILTGIKVTDVATAAAAVLRGKGVKTVIVTLGAKGALVVAGGLQQLVEAPVVKAVDTTAAGDVFNGALAVALAEGEDILTAVVFACRAASISVTRLGAQASAPLRSEV